MAHSVEEAQLGEQLKNILQFSLELAKQKLELTILKAQLQILPTNFSSNQQLVAIIEKILRMMVNAGQSSKSSSAPELGFINESEYIKLEESLQKYEADARAHVKSQQQFKLYCEELEAKIQGLEIAKHELMVSSKETILTLKRENEELLGRIKKIRETQGKGEKRKSYDYVETVLTDNDGAAFNKKLFLYRNSPVLTSYKSTQKKESKDGLLHPESQLRNRLDHYSKAMQSVEISRSRKGSISHVKVRERKAY